MNGGSSGSSMQSFDITVEKDVLALLQAVRGSALDEESKNAVRDLIFALRGEITADRVGELEMYLRPLNVQVVGGTAPTPTEEATTTVPPTAEPEPAPSTESPTPAAPPTRAPAADAPVPATATPSMGRPTPHFGAAPQSDVSAAPPPPTPESVAHENVPPAPTETPAPTEQPAVPSAPQTPPAPTPDQAPLTTTETEAENVPTPASDNPADAQKRIAAIKRAVNEAVGNPVNLIDANNEVGREYMNALLEAMKAVNSSSNVSGAMQRLEAAYAAVEKTLAAGPVTTGQATAVPETANPADTKPAAAQEAEVPVPTAEPPTPASEAPPQTAETATAPVPPTNDRWQASPDASVPPPAPAAPATENTSTAPTVDAGAPLRSVAAVADEIEVTKPKEEPKVPQPATGDPLMAESVTAGLEQLLTEWSLFKGGGILGSGPKGVEHPLYKELRNLPMNLVIAGRFEGATPEVKQSIHDYMNGWRYEQGMTHDLQETFEHYLRRVVSTIIDKQAKSS